MLVATYFVHDHNRQLFISFNLYHMGTAQQNKTEEGPEEALTINHPRFTNLRVVSAPTEDDEGVIEIIVPLPSENQFKKWDKRVAEVPDSDNIFLPLKRRFEKTEFCGSGGIATIAYKYYPYLLSDQVINRCNMEGKFFEEAELWYLVYSVISAGDAFHAAGRKIGDVRPQNVFISPQGQVRVATQLTWPNQQTNYMKSVFEKETTYLSPEELKDISYGKLDEPANFALNEAFSVGLTCLDAATLTDSTKLYEPNNKFNYGRLEERLAALQKSGNYSAPLVLLIKGLCQVEEEKRPTCRELASWLDKYEAFITELQEFTITELPEKLSKLAPEKPKENRPPPQSYVQFQGQQQQPSLPAYTTAPVARTQQTQFFTQGQYQQFLYEPQFPSNNPNPTYVVNGSGVNANRSISQVSNNNNNNNPSIITFQKDPRSMLDNPGNSQLRSASINLQQIDEQLQMSRKLFPS